MTDQQAPKYIPVAVVNYGVTEWQVERTSDSKVLVQPLNGLPVSFLSCALAQTMIDFMVAYGDRPAAFGVRRPSVKPELAPMHIDGPL